MTRNRPGIIVRLSNLIVVQVLFIFAALALVLFVPESDQELGEQVVDLERDLLETARIVRGFQLAAGIDDDAGEAAYVGLTPLLDSLQRVDHAAVLLPSDSVQVQVLYAYRGFEGSEPGIDGDQDVSTFCNYDILHLMSKTHQPLQPQTVMDPHHLVSYQVLIDRETKSRLILVLAVEHGLTVSAKSNLQYTILILFLCSTLVSLLTVNLLSRKFKRPLDRIIAGLAETADGKLHNLADMEADPHLGKLAGAYNSMSRRLWENRRELDAYFTKLQKANQDLTESQSFLSTLIDDSPLSVIVTDTTGRVLIFNQAASEVFGYTADEAVGLPLDRMLVLESDNNEAASDEHAPRSFEVVCRRKDGTPFPGYIISSQINAEHSNLKARLYICRDITDSKNFQEMMIRLDRYYTRGEMAGDIAHEINNYLAVLLGNVELLPLLLKKGKMDKVDHKLEVMKTALHKIARFSDGLLDSPPDTVRLEPASINQIVENVVAFLKPQNKFDMVDVQKTLSDEIPIMMLDTSQAQQLLVNLINNAADALIGQEGDKVICVETSATEVDGQRCLILTVRDNGPGVVEEKEAMLFKSRFTTKRRGHGIGLITCRKIVDNHRGQITYLRNDGAEFNVQLPVVSPHEEAADVFQVASANTSA